MSGPFESAAIVAMLADGQLEGGAEISADREDWRPARTLAAHTPLLARPETADPELAPLDLGIDDGILLAPLEMDFGNSPDGGGAHAPPWHNSPGDGGTDNGGGDSEGVDQGVSLELVERKPASRGAAPYEPLGMRAPDFAPSESESPAPGTSLAPRAGSSHPVGEDAPLPVTVASEASATVASLLQAELEPASDDATKPVRLDEAKPVPLETRVRPRTLTAARGGGAAPKSPGRWRSLRRMLWTAGTVAGISVVAVVAVLMDLPDRLRGEPERAVILGPVENQIAQDHFQAFSEGARLLEEAAGARSHVPITRATAAELLASSVVIHGGDRGRVVHAEALLDLKTEPKAPAARTARARALAWVALAKGRWKEADAILAAAAGLAESDRAALRGWAALGRQDASRATAAFELAVQANPAPAPSRVAARYALARAREADLSPGAEDAFRAVLAQAPAHFGAALGLARVSKLSATSRLKLVETVIAKQSGDASRPELAEAYVLMSRSARQAGLLDRAEAAMKHARELDPSSVAVAVLAGDLLLADGRTDDAVARYRLALAAPVSAVPTSSVRFARVAALVESARGNEATAALADIARRMPGDPRVAFWRGRAEERAHPADGAGAAAAERDYREALARDPRFLPARLQLARLLLDQHRSADALTVLRQAEKQGSAPVTVRVALGRALLTSGNAIEAVRTFRQAIASDAKSPAAHLGLAAALEAGGDFEGARAELAAIAARGDVAGLGARLAAVLVKLGRKEEALATLQKEIAQGAASSNAAATDSPAASDGGAANKVVAARLALELGHTDVARTLAQAAVADDPRTPGALLVLADVLRAQGDLGRALSELRRALAVDGSAEVQLEYGRALAAMGRAEDALAAFAQAAPLAEAAVERGRILLRRGDVEAASRELATATAGLPGNAEAFLLMGEAEDRLGHVTRAEAAWKTAVRLAPGSGESRYRLGRLQLDQGQAPLALGNLRAAGEHLSGGPRRAGESDWQVDLYFQLGFAELRQGSKARAVAAFRRYLDVASADAPARAEVARQMRELAP